MGVLVRIGGSISKKTATECDINLAKARKQIYCLKQTGGKSKKSNFKPNWVKESKGLKPAEGEDRKVTTEVRRRKTESNAAK